MKVRHMQPAGRFLKRNPVTSEWEGKLQQLCQVDFPMANFRSKITLSSVLLFIKMLGMSMLAKKQVRY